MWLSIFGIILVVAILFFVWVWWTHPMCPKCAKHATSLRNEDDEQAYLLSQKVRRVNLKTITCEEHGTTYLE